MELTEKQKRFIDYYIQSGNATESAKKAGYSKNTAYSIGQRLLKNVEVQTVINWIIVNKVDKKSGIGEKFSFKIIRRKKMDSE